MEKELKGYGVGRAPEKEGFVCLDCHSGWGASYLAKIEISQQAIDTLATKISTLLYYKPFEVDKSRAGNGFEKFRLCDLEDGLYKTSSVARSYQMTVEYLWIKEHQVIQVFEENGPAYLAVFGINLTSLETLRRQKRDRENQEAQQQNSERGLLPLRGSQKQIVWAESIRSDILNRLKKIERVPLETLKIQDTASWWIDNRNTPLERFSQS